MHESRRSGWAMLSRSFAEQFAHPRLGRVVIDPVSDLEVRDPQRRLPAMLRWEDVGERVSEGG